MFGQSQSGVRCHGMKANPAGFLFTKYECFLISICKFVIVEFANTVDQDTALNMSPVVRKPVFGVSD